MNNTIAATGFGWLEEYKTSESTTGKTMFGTEVSARISGTSVSTGDDIAVQVLIFRALSLIPLILAIITIVISLLRIYFWVKKSPRLSTLWWVMWLVTIIAFFGGYFLYQYMMMKIMYGV